MQQRYKARAPAAVNACAWLPAAHILRESGATASALHASLSARAALAQDAEHFESRQSRKGGRAGAFGQRGGPGGGAGEAGRGGGARAANGNGHVATELDVEDAFAADAALAGLGVRDGACRVPLRRLSTCARAARCGFAPVTLTSGSRTAKSRQERFPGTVAMPLSPAKVVWREGP